MFALRAQTTFKLKNAGYIQQLRQIINEVTFLTLSKYIIIGRLEGGSKKVSAGKKRGVKSFERLRFTNILTYRKKKIHVCIQAYSLSQTL